MGTKLTPGIAILAASVILAGALIAGALALSLRHQLVSTRWGIIDEDTWTGRITACEIAELRDYNARIDDLMWPREPHQDAADAARRLDELAAGKGEVPAPPTEPKMSIAEAKNRLGDYVICAY